MLNTDKSNELRVISFEPHLVQIEIINFTEWKEENTDSNIKIGSFLKIEDGNEKNIIVLVKSFKMIPKHEDVVGHEENEEGIEEDEYKGIFIINTQPIGQLEKDEDDNYIFTKGIKNISIPPNGVSLATDNEIQNIFRTNNNVKLIFSEHLINKNIKIEIDGDNFFSKHIAVVGSTGSGKSCTVAKIIQEAKKENNNQLNNTHIIIFDIHGEYKRSFPDANYLSVDENSLNLPYWLMNSEELEDMFVERSERGSNNQVSQLKYAITENKKKYNPNIRVTYDSPVYFSIEEVINYIYNKNKEVINKKEDEEQKGILCNGQLIEDENQYFEERYDFASPSTTKDKKASNGTFNGDFNKFLSRLETKMNDERLNFILHRMKGNNNTYKTEDLKTIIESLLGYTENNFQNITTIDLSSLPFEVISIVVSIVTRIVFDFSYYSTKMARGNDTNKTPFMLVYEEAHKYIPKNEEVRYKNTRLAVERIAKEGRKYGVSAMIVSQRPSEISSTVFSQCNNFIVMRLNNPDDQSYVKRLLPEAVISYGDALSSLEKREVLIVGDAISTPTIARVMDANPTPKSDDIKFYKEWKEDWKNIAFDSILNQINKPHEL